MWERQVVEKRTFHWAWVILGICFVANFSWRYAWFIIGGLALAMGTVIGAWTPFYGAGAILTHWVTGILRDTTGVYNHVFIINVMMSAVAIVLITPIKHI